MLKFVNICLLVCVHTIASGRVAAQSGIREWTDSAGRKVKAKLIELGEDKLTLQYIDGRSKEVLKNCLSDADRRYLTSGIKLVSNPQVPLVEVSSVAKQSVKITDTREEAYTVYKEIRTCVPVMERYGDRCQFCRIVYRWQSQLVPETRTRTLQQLRTIQSLFQVEGAGIASKQVQLEAPRSAGAIASQITGLINGSLPQSSHPMQVIDGGLAFPLRRISETPASDGALYDIVMRPDTDARIVIVEVAAVTPSNQRTDVAKPFANSMLKLIEATLKTQ